MRIKQLEIYGYGKWVDQTFDLSEGLQIFLGNNEAGKSTLMSFVHSILFGFPTRNSTLLRYEPQESSKYGGKIIGHDGRFGEVMIERVHGKVTGNVTVTLEDGTTGSDELLDTLLKGMTRESYQNIFSFSLTDIENVHQLNKNQLSRYLLNIGAHATDHYLDLVDEFQKNAYDMYRPSGRIPPLNKQLVAIAEQEDKLVKLEKRNEGYLNLIEKNNRQNEQIHRIEKQQKKQEDELENLREFKKEWHVFEEIQSLQQQILNVQLPPLKEDGHYLLEEYKKDITKITEELQEITLQVQLQKEMFLNPEIIENYEENKEEISNLEQDLPEIVEQLSQLKAIENQLTQNRKILTDLENDLKIQNQVAVPTAFITEEKTNINKWLASFYEIEPELLKMTSDIQVLENELNLKNQRADQYEEIMWDNQYLKDIEDQIQRKERQAVAAPEKKSSVLPMILRVLGIGLIVGAFFTDSLTQWILGGVGVLFIVLSFATLRKKKPQKQAIDQESSEQSREILRKEYEKQLAIKNEWQTLLGEIDAIQMNYQGQMKKQDERLNTRDALIRKWKMVLIAHHLPETLPIEAAKTVLAQTTQLVHLDTENTDLTKQQLELRTHLESRVALIHEILSVDKDLPLVEKVHQFRLYLKQLNQELGKEQTKIDELHTLKQKEAQLTALKQDTQNKVEHLLEATGVKTEDEFLGLYQKKEKLDAQKSRVNFLKENAPSFDSNKKLPTKEEVTLTEEKLETRLTELAQENKAAVVQLANTQLTIENLEKDGTYTDALQDFENQKTMTQRLVDEWISDKLAAGIIQTTLNQVTKDRFEEIIVEVNNYFRLLTDGEYEKIVFKEEDLYVQHRNGSVMDVKVLSRGTAEPLYVAIRLAYIVNMQDMVKLPIIMDDPFVNFDQTRKKNMYRLLSQLSEKMQIIYFTFDGDVFNQFAENQMVDLEKFK